MGVTTSTEAAGPAPAAPHAELRQIKGPSALGTDPRRFAHLTWAMAVTDFKLRFFGSALGYLWQLVRPLMLFGVLLTVFTQVIHLSGGVKLYAQSLLFGIVLYNFLADATTGSVRSITEREPLVRKVEFPRLAVPMSAVLQATFNLAMNFVVVTIFLLAAGGQLRWSWLQIPVLIALLGMLCIGLAMLLSTLFVRYRDVEPIWEVIMLTLFYASPIFYPIQIIKGPHAGLIVDLLMVNPFAAILQQGRHAFIDPSHPSFIDATGSWWHVLPPLAIGIVLILAGGQLFRKRAPRIAEDL
jgi:ABC-2 type transport system permease protein